MAAGLQWLEPVSLNELDAIAALRTRVDRKYVVPADTASRMVAALGSQTQVLEIADRREFSYSSMYFDTPDRVAFRSAAYRRRRRFKARTRLYQTQNVCMFEVKTKGARGATVKSRMDYDVEHRFELTEGAQHFVDTITGQSVGARLSPVLATRYQRSTLLDRETASRLTLDTQLVVESHAGAKRSFRDVVIIEVKTAAGRTAYDRWLWAAGARPLPMSKFCVGLALLEPNLPDNKWRSAIELLG